MKFLFYFLATACLLFATSCTKKQYAFYAPSKSGDWSGTTAGNAPVVASTQAAPTLASRRLVPVKAQSMAARSAKTRTRVVVKQGQTKAKIAFHYSAQHPVLPVPQEVTYREKTAPLTILAIGSAILGLATFWSSLTLGLIFGILAVGLGIGALVQLNRDRSLTGRAGAVLAIILGGLLITILLLAGASSFITFL